MRSSIRYLMIVALLTLQGCATLFGKVPDQIPKDLGAVTGEQVEVVSHQLDDRFPDLALRVNDRELLAVVACGTAGAIAYFSEAGVSKEQRLYAAISAANRHGRRYYNDVLKDGTFLELAQKKFNMDVGSPDGAKIIALVRYFTTHIEDMRKLLHEISPSAALEVGSS